MSYTYTTYKAALANLLVESESGASFVGILPSIIDYAEQRIYRELDLLNTQIQDSSSSTSGSVRNFTLPTASGNIVVVNGINVISPAGSTVSSGTRIPLTPISLNALDVMWPSSASNTGTPSVFSMVNQNTIALGPTPDSAYVVEVVGTIRPTPLSETNTTTFLSLYLPDLFMAASMVFGTGWQRNYGAQADDPKMSTSWEGQYQALKVSATTEEFRKKMEAGGWGSLSTPVQATPTRP